MSRPWLLAIDTATSTVVVAAGTPDGRLLEARTFAAEHRHGSHLLPTIQALAADRELDLSDLAGVVVGTGPGAFTGLRVGLATAKTLAHELDVPLVGVSTADALLAAFDDVAGPATLLLPAGPHDRTVAPRRGPARLVAGDAGEPEPERAVAVDLADRASAAAVRRGAEALAGLPASLIRIGAERLAAGATDDVERLVPAYVSLPRGVTREVGEGGMAWSRDPR